MKVVILAGGKGTRLLPYSKVIPKPLMPVGDRPILQIILSQLRRYGFSQVTLAVGHLADLVEAYFGDGSKYGVRIDYSREDKPLGTAGPLSLIKGLNDTFLVMNGDILTNLDYAGLINFHRENRAIATIATYWKQVRIDLGIVELDGDFVVSKYVEKPIFKYDVSMGIYVFEPEVLNFIEPSRYFDFPNLVRTLMKAGRKVIAFPFKGYWLDIGRHEDYAQAQEEFEDLRE
ncbi:MAG: sugar phosphate nucleotidyltransferase [Candidatus Hodarchaeota archaeon]